MPVTDDLLGVARAAFDSIYDGPGGEDAAHRAALDAVYPMIREAVLREAAAEVHRLGDKADTDDGSGFLTAGGTARALLALAQQGAQQGREDGR